MTDRPLTDYIRTIPDFPVPGVQFRDVTTLFAAPVAFRRAVDELVAGRPSTSGPTFTTYVPSHLSCHVLLSRSEYAVQNPAPNTTRLINEARVRVHM